MAEEVYQFYVKMSKLYEEQKYLNFLLNIHIFGF